MGFVRQYVGYIQHMDTHLQTPVHTLAFYLPGLLPECPQPAHTCHRLTHTHAPNSDSNTREHMRKHAFHCHGCCEADPVSMTTKMGLLAAGPQGTPGTDTETCSNERGGARQIERLSVMRDEERENGEGCMR